MNANLLRQLPAVHELLATPEVQDLLATHPHERIVAVVRAELAAVRSALKQGQPAEFPISTPSTWSHWFAQRVVNQFATAQSAQLRSVINATGIVLHTNLGRSPLAEVAAQAAYQAGRGYLNLELDLATGKRSSRQNPIRQVLAPLVGSESATAVNNCAAATVIVLRALAAGKEVIVSRGQLIEIGGSFRIPEIMAVSGATLREVGTTNITRLADYEKAITANTGLLMRVHTSNYRVRGFTKEVSLSDLVSLGKKYQLPVIDDVGSGALIDFARFGLPGDPIVSQSIEAGADLVLFSGDKLLGGPQAGLIVGKKALIQKIEKDPLMRAFRLDKMSLAALEATLRIYQHPERALEQIPILRMLNTPFEELLRRANTLAEKIGLISGLKAVRVQESTAFVGGGSLPELPLRSAIIELQTESISEEVFAEKLRLSNPAVLARLQKGKVLLDVRTIEDSQEGQLLEVVAQTAKTGDNSLADRSI